MVKLKRTISILLVICAVLGCIMPAFAQESTGGKISLRINSDIAGLTEKDAEKLIEIKGGNVVYSTRGDGPVSINDYAGTHTAEPLAAGRTYNIYYTLTAADGSTLPDSLIEKDLEIECGKGVTVISSQIVTAKEKTEDGIFIENFRGLMIYAVVKVDGNVFQQIYGFIYDLILKIRAWSLY